MASEYRRLYISRGSVTIAGQDYRSGDTFEASADEVFAAIVCGEAVPWPPEEVAEGAPPEGTLAESVSEREITPEAGAQGAIDSSPSDAKPAARKRPAKSKD